MNPRTSSRFLPLSKRIFKVSMNANHVGILYVTHSLTIKPRDRPTDAARTICIKIYFKNYHKRGVVFNNRRAECFPLRQTTGIGVPGIKRTEGLILLTSFANFHTSLFFSYLLGRYNQNISRPFYFLSFFSFRRFFFGTKDEDLVRKSITLIE